MFLISALEGETEIGCMGVQTIGALAMLCGRHRKLTVDISNTSKMAESPRKRDIFIRSSLCNFPFHKRPLSVQGANMPFH
jgi:hypothetical protein